MNLWFNQNGDSSTGVPVMAGLPAPNATPEQIANDPGFLVPSALDDVTLPPPTMPPNYSPVDVLPDGIFDTTPVTSVSPVYLPLYMTQGVSKIRNTPGTIGANMIKGEYTGMQSKSLPPQYQIQWDDGTMTMENRQVLGLLQPILTAPPTSDPRPIEPIGPVQEPSVETPVVLEPQPMSCGDKEIMIPVVDKCVDKTMALVFGAIALYLILNKDK